MRSYSVYACNRRATGAPVVLRFAAVCVQLKPSGRLLLLLLVLLLLLLWLWLLLLVLLLLVAKDTAAEHSCHML